MFFKNFNAIRLLRFSLPLVLFLLISIFLWKGLQQDPRLIPSPLINRALPNFDYPSLQSSNHRINHTQFQHRVTLLNVWASWCASCRLEHATLMAIAATKQVEVYGLNYKDNRTAASRWLEENGDPYQDSIYDEKGQLAIDLGVYGTPETFIIDQAGIIRYKYVGPITAQVWKEVLAPQVEQLLRTTG